MTKEEYKNLFDGRPSVVKFGAQWCNPCKDMDKILERIEPLYPNINFVHVDVEESDDLVQMFQISNVPTTMFINSDGENFVRKVGLMHEKAIIAEIDKLC